MREDMAKIIVERPRHAAKGEKFGRRGQTDLEDLPQKESLRGAHRSGRKGLNENLAPLRRFLEKSANRPWDKVYSEICEHINVNSAVQAHIRQHIFDFVAKHAFMQDGKVFVQQFWSRKGAIPIEDSNYRLYVHPINGLLKKVKRPKGWAKPYLRGDEESPATRIDVSKKQQFRKFRGIWYVIGLKPIPQNLSSLVGKYEHPTPQGEICDVVLGTTLYYLVRVCKTQHEGDRLQKTYGSDGVYGATIKQMNAKELKAAGLKNDAPTE